jgi:uncharacterized membrane protein
MESQALINNDAAVLGLLALTLGAIFWTASSDAPFWKKFYKYVPVILVAYFIPSLFNTFGIVDPDQSQMYFVSSRYLLPATLVLLTLSIDLSAIVRLGPKALIMFATGTISIILGGPLAILLMSLVSPETVGGAGPDAVWRGLTTVAGSWIGGGANQAAMKEVYEVGNEVFSAMVAVDVIVANLWLAVLLVIAGKAKQIDEWMGADTSAIGALQKKVEEFQAKHSRIPDLTDFMLIIAVGFGVTGFSHIAADWLAPWLAETAPVLSRFSLTSKFFWLVVIATTGGLILSFTKVKNLEGAGASKVGSAMLYILIASIGLNMDISAIVERPGLFIVGGIWITFHAISMLVMARLIKAPMFYMAVGSQANIGGAASAPVVASAFHPSLAPVGVLLAVLGYAVGTYGAWLTGQLMRIVAQ